MVTATKLMEFLIFAAMVHMIRGQNYLLKPEIHKEKLAALQACFSLSAADSLNKLRYDYQWSEVENDNEAKCNLKCFYEKIGFLNAEGILQSEVIKSYSCSADLERINSSCDGSADNCNFAFCAHKLLYGYDCRFL